MTDGIGHISGYGNYGVGGYANGASNGNNGADGADSNNVITPQPNYEQVDPNRVMEFLSANNFFVNLTNAPAPVEGVETDPTVADRVAGYMENFELIYGIVEQEFGPELAPLVMDLVMDRLMGMVD